MSTFEIIGLPQVNVENINIPMTADPEHNVSHDHMHITAPEIGIAIVVAALAGLIGNKIISHPSPKFDSTHDEATIAYASRKSRR